MEGKGPGAGLTIVTASSKHQKTVAPDRWNASFPQLRKVLAGGLRDIRAHHHLAPHRERNPITRETSPGIPQDTPPKIPHPTQPGNSTECLRRGAGRYARVHVWYRHLYLGRHPYKQNDRTLCLCAYTCIYSGARADTHTHTPHTRPPHPPTPPTHTQMGLNHQKGMTSHSLQELGEIFRQAIMLNEAPQISRFDAESTKGYTVNRTEQIRSRLIDTTKEHMGGGQRRRGWGGVGWGGRGGGGGWRGGENE